MMFGFIGTGNMGGALAKAAAKKVQPEQLLLCNRTMEKAQALADTLGCQCASAAQIAQNCSYIFLGVKPQMMADLLKELSPILAKRETPFVLVSMAAGLTMDTIRKMAGGNYGVIRIMPNTPVSVGSGVILYDATENVQPAELDVFCQAMAEAGWLEPLPEKLIDAGSALAGCGPAYGCMFVEALADGAVACGLPRQQALKYAAQMLLGTAKLALESQQHPGALKDAVCSPGGSTIEGVKVLEENGFRGGVMDAIAAAYKRTKELGKTE